MTLIPALTFISHSVAMEMWARYPDYRDWKIGRWAVPVQGGYMVITPFWSFSP